MKKNPGKAAKIERARMEKMSLVQSKLDKNKELLQGLEDRIKLIQEENILLEEELQELAE